jgi:glutamine amidotransferase
MLYDHLHGTTDSELFFLMCLQEGLDADPCGAVERATRRVMQASREAGIEPAFKLTAAFADGERLFAVRYASAGAAPTLYAGGFRETGWCIMSEPFDRENPNWQAVPPGSFVTLTQAGLAIASFEPEPAALALAG